jgi:1-acyl-sn-glycerol-3-phosphate acyltransferase
MRLLARLLVRVFFRRVEVEGAGRLATPRPTVLVADHRNGLVDALVLMAVLPRVPRFLGKSTLFAIPPLWPFLRLAGVVPVHRSEDRGAGGRNAEAFARSREILRSGGLLAVFPEGVSHNETSLQRLHTGAARIALEASVDADIEHVDTVAVALVYDDKSRFRSRALVRVGEPQPVGRWQEPYRRDGPATVRALTDDLGDRIRRIAPDIDSWRQAERLARMAEIVTRSPDDVLPHDVQLAERQRIADALADVERTHGRDTALDALSDAYDLYRRDLDRLGLTDDQVAASYRSDRLALTALASLAKVAAALPLAAVGVAVHLVPYEVVRLAARLPRNAGIRSTVKLLGCLLLFPAAYLVVGVGVGRRLGPVAGGLAALASPVGGYLAVRVSERLRRTGRAIHGARFAHRRRPLAHSVRVDRAAVVAAALGVLDRTAPRGPRPEGVPALP